MKKPLIVALAAAVPLAFLAAALAFAFVRHVVAAGGLFAGRTAHAAIRQGSQDGASEEDSAKVIRFASNPSPLPPFLVNDLDGNVVSSADLRGKVVLLTFWATWCPPCREEIPEMIELANRYKDRVRIVAISQDDDPPGRVRDFAREAGINYTIVMGSKELSDEYGGVPALPTTFVVDTKGGIVQKHVGLYPMEVYDNEIRALLNLPVDATVKTFEDTGQIFLKNAERATDLPGVDFAKLTPDQKRAALKKMNSEICTCGCKLTIAQCRINDESCPTSVQLAAKIVQQAGSANTPSRPAAVNRQ
jgi:thiol-disulfide isomerase/thioredoxin